MGINLAGGEYSWGVRFGELGFMIFFLLNSYVDIIISVPVCLPVWHNKSHLFRMGFN